MNDVDITGMTLEAMQTRAAALRSDILQTPVVPLFSPMVSDVLDGAHVALKLECFQHTGTFKARGALSVARSLDDDTRGRGITAASAGNHAIAAGWAAAKLGISAKVVMQDNANPFRVDLARATGAEVIMKPPGAETFAEAERLVREEGRIFIHPFEGLHTSLGTAGVGLELMAQVTDLDAVVVSVGGGGLISGVAAAVKAINPGCRVYGVEPVGADSMSQSLAAGAPVTLDKVDTIADSLGPPMALPFGHALCAVYVDDVVTVSDDAICAGMVVLQQAAKLAVEPAAGAAMAGALGPLRGQLAGRRVGLIVCGANIDTDSYLAQLARGQAALPALLS
jgi:threonine dehydratase